MTNALIVDDDRDSAELVSLVLTLVGIETEVVYSAKAALAHLSNNEPDIIVLDMRLGMEINGNDILFQIRSNPRFDRTRVVVLTGYPAMAEPVGDLADLVLLKPIEIEQLRTLVSRLTLVEPKPYSFRDPITNLYTLKFFNTRVEHAYERLRRRPDFHYAVIVMGYVLEPPTDPQLDLDEQEYLMKIIAERLRNKFRPTDTFGRLDSQRIVALCEEMDNLQALQVIVQRLKKELSATYEIHKRLITLKPLIGHCVSDPLYKKAGTIFEAALGEYEAARLEVLKQIATPEE